ncbi:hypothetical protein [Pseudonocardia adelaidensis]|uniref:Uncharacterized protein n=1 Tax=Pseudonocardia adelaidensis TaxID=648754 RepID=A0ABP9NPX5_9PSEU
MVEIARAVPVAGLSDGAVARAGDDFEWASLDLRILWREARDPAPPPPDAEGAPPFQCYRWSS